ncbi:MAG: hypothetical protein MK135_10300 [Polyangiaceae bacterium]|nr:hypothetical protein [Polyangiaceae bacterium]
MDDKTLKIMEEKFARGLTSGEILEVFSNNSQPLSEASLRKYVQLGLLPRSVRVGEKGKHRGSKGVYPVRVLRRILLIRKLMEQEWTIEQIQNDILWLRGDLEELDGSLASFLLKLGQAREAKPELGFREKEISKVRNIAADLMQRLRGLDARFSASAGSTLSATHFLEVGESPTLQVAENAPQRRHRRRAGLVESEQLVSESQQAWDEEAQVAG